MISAELLRQARIESVAQSLREDIGDGDITAQLTPADEIAHARVITREDMVLAGRPWVDAIFAQLDPNVEVIWLKNDGDTVLANDAFYIARQRCARHRSRRRIISVCLSLLFRFCFPLAQHN